MWGIHTSMGAYKHMWVHRGIYRVHTDIYGCIVALMGTYKNIWVYKDIYGCILTYMGAYMHL